jgi:hypothetical protein
VLGFRYLLKDVHLLALPIRIAFIVVAIFVGALPEYATNQVSIHSLEVSVFVLFKHPIDFDDLLQLHQTLVTVQEFNCVIAMMVRIR